MPKAVFEGFTMSVALTIGLGQLNFGLGLTPGLPQPIPGLNIAPQIYGLAASIEALNTMQGLSTSLFLLSVVGLLMIYRMKPSIRGTAVPWLVPFAVVTALFGFLCDPEAAGLVPLEVSTLKAKYGIMQFQLATSLQPLTEIISNADGGTYNDYIMGAFSVALVAIMETLISAKIAATRSQFSFDNEQELQGLALSHAACGICGLMPPSGVFVRTSVNLSTGATYKISQFMQALWVLLLASICMPALSYLPQFAVAAILVVASIRMVPWHYLRQLWCEHKWHFGLFLIVALVCWIISSVSGLLLGTAVMLLVTGKETAQGHAEISIVAGTMAQVAESTTKIEDALKMDDGCIIQARGPLPGKVGAQLKDQLRTLAGGNQVYLYKIFGQLDFLNGEKHIDRLRILAGTGPMAVVISLQNAGWTDPDGVQSLRSMVEMLEEAKVGAFIISARPKVTQALEKEDWHQKLMQKKRVSRSEQDVDVLCKQLPQPWEKFMV
jgi:MFS superfamily sulfate permease-like transporter